MQSQQPLGNGFPMGLGSAEREPPGGSQPDRPLLAPLSQPQNPMTQPNMQPNFAGPLPPLNQGPPSGPATDPQGRPQQPNMLPQGARQMPNGPPPDFSQGQGLADLGSLPLPPLNPGMQQQRQQQQQQHQQPQQQQQQQPPTKAAAIAQAQAMLQSLSAQLLSQERKMHQMLQATTRMGMPPGPMPPPGQMPMAPPPQGQMPPPQLPFPQLPFPGNFQGPPPQMQMPPPQNINQNFGLPFGQQPPPQQMAPMQPPPGFPPIGPPFMQNQFPGGGPIGLPLPRPPYQQMDQMPGNDMPNAMGGPGGFMGGMRGLMDNKFQPGGGFPQQGGFPGAPMLPLGVRRPPMPGQMLAPNPQQQFFTPPTVPLPGNLRPDGQQQPSPPGVPCVSPVLRSAQVERASEWVTRARAEYQQSLVDHSTLMQSMTTGNMNDENSGEMEAALNKMKVMLKENDAAKKALEAAEYAEKRWTVQPPPHQAGHRIKCSAIKGEMEAGNLDSGCMLYPVDDSNQQPLTAAQVVGEFERIMLAARSLKESADDESRRLNVPLMTRAGGGQGAGQGQGQGHGQGLPPVQRQGQQQPPEQPQQARHAGRGGLLTEGQSSSVEQGAPGERTRGKDPLTTGHVSPHGFGQAQADEAGAGRPEQTRPQKPPLQFVQPQGRQNPPMPQPAGRPDSGAMQNTLPGMQQHLPLPPMPPMSMPLGMQPLQGARPPLPPVRTGTQPQLPQQAMPPPQLGGNPSLIQLHNQWQMSPMYGRDDPTLLDPFTDGGPNGGTAAHLFVGPDDDMVNLDSVADRLQQDGQLLPLLGMPHMPGSTGGIQNPLSPPQQRKFDHFRIPEKQARSKADSLLATTLNKRRALGLCEKDIRCTKRQHTGKCKLAEDAFIALREAESALGVDGQQGGSDRRRKRGPYAPRTTKVKMSKQQQVAYPSCKCGRRVKPTRADGNAPLIYSCNVCGFFLQSDPVAALLPSPKAQTTPRGRQGMGVATGLATTPAVPPAAAPADDDDDAETQEDTDDDADATLSGEDGNGGDGSGTARAARRRRPSSRLDTAMYDVDVKALARARRRPGALSDGSGSQGGETMSDKLTEDLGSGHHTIMGPTSAGQQQQQQQQQQPQEDALHQQHQHQQQYPEYIEPLFPQLLDLPVAPGTVQGPAMLHIPTPGDSPEDGAGGGPAATTPAGGVAKSSRSQVKHVPKGPYGCWRNVWCVKDYGHKGACNKLHKPASKTGTDASPRAPGDGTTISGPPSKPGGGASRLHSEAGSPTAQGMGPGSGSQQITQVASPVDAAEPAGLPSAPMDGAMPGSSSAHPASKVLKLQVREKGVASPRIPLRLPTQGRGRTTAPAGTPAVPPALPDAQSAYPPAVLQPQVPPPPPSVSIPAPVFQGQHLYSTPGAIEPIGPPAVEEYAEPAYEEMEQQDNGAAPVLAHASYYEDAVLAEEEEPHQVEAAAEAEAVAMDEEEEYAAGEGYQEESPAPTQEQLLEDQEEEDLEGVVEQGADPIAEEHVPAFSEPPADEEEVAGAEEEQEEDDGEEYDAAAVADGDSTSSGEDMTEDMRPPFVWGVRRRRTGLEIQRRQQEAAAAAAAAEAAAVAEQYEAVEWVPDAEEPDQYGEEDEDVEEVVVPFGQCPKRDYCCLAPGHSGHCRKATHFASERSGRGSRRSGGAVWGADEVRKCSRRAHCIKPYAHKGRCNIVKVKPITVKDGSVSDEPVSSASQGGGDAGGDGAKDYNDEVVQPAQDADEDQEMEEAPSDDEEQEKEPDAVVAKDAAGDAYIDPAVAPVELPAEGEYDDELSADEEEEEEDEDGGVVMPDPGIDEATMVARGLHPVPFEQRCPKDPSCLNYVGHRGRCRLKPRRSTKRWRSGKEKKSDAGQEEGEGAGAEASQHRLKKIKVGSAPWKGERPPEYDEESPAYSPEAISSPSQPISSPSGVTSKGGPSTKFRLVQKPAGASPTSPVPLGPMQPSSRSNAGTSNDQQGEQGKHSLPSQPQAEPSRPSRHAEAAPPAAAVPAAVPAVVEPPAAGSGDSHSSMEALAGTAKRGLTVLGSDSEEGHDGGDVGDGEEHAEYNGAAAGGTGTAEEPDTTPHDVPVAPKGDSDRCTRNVKCTKPSGHKGWCNVPKDGEPKPKRGSQGAPQGEKKRSQRKGKDKTLDNGSGAPASDYSPFKTPIPEVAPMPSLPPVRTSLPSPEEESESWVPPPNAVRRPLPVFTPRGLAMYREACRRGPTAAETLARRKKKSTWNFHRIDLPASEETQHALRGEWDPAIGDPKPPPSPKGPVAHRSVPAQVLHAEFVSCVADLMAWRGKTARTFLLREYGPLKDAYARQLDLVDAAPPQPGPPGALQNCGHGFGLSHPPAAAVVSSGSGSQMGWMDIIKVSGNVVIRRGKSKIDGYGLVAKEPIAAGAFITELVGEVIPSQEAAHRAESYSKHPVSHVVDSYQRFDDDEAARMRAAKPPGDSFMFPLDGAWVVDATAAGSLGRFMNHSCAPNAEARVVLGYGDWRHVCFFALKDIGEGEEVCIDYGLTAAEGKSALACRCGAAECSGRIDHHGHSRS